MTFSIFKRARSETPKGQVLVPFTAEQILAASMVGFAATVIMFVGVRLRWHDPFTTSVFCSGWFFHPTLAYIAIRKMTEVGFAWRWFLSALICLCGITLWALTIYFLVSRDMIL
jgi:small basic protein